MSRKLISSGSEFEEKIGYSRAVVQGNMVFLSGTTGFDYGTMTISADMATQTEQCLLNIESALEKAGARLTDIVRVLYIVPDASLFEQSWPILKKYLGEVKPAATMISANLYDERMLIEIEVTAMLES